MKNLNLILSVCILIPVAFGYGLVPKTTLPWVFDIRLDTVDMMNICRTTMVLYLGIATLLLRGIFNEKHWENATFLNGVFMGCLSLGRVLSLFLDGEPSQVLVFGLFGESILSLFAFFQLKKYARDTYF